MKSGFCGQKKNAAGLSPASGIDGASSRTRRPVAAAAANTQLERLQESSRAAGSEPAEPVVSGESGALAQLKLTESPA